MLKLVKKFKTFQEGAEELLSVNTTIRKMLAVMDGCSVAHIERKSGFIFGWTKKEEEYEFYASLKKYIDLRTYPDESDYYASFFPYLRNHGWKLEAVLDEIEVEIGSQYFGTGGYSAGYEIIEGEVEEYKIPDSDFDDGFGAGYKVLLKPKTEKAKIRVWNHDKINGHRNLGKHGMFVLEK